MVSTSEELGPRAKRDQILAGARRVFLRDGFAASSTDAIAAEAKVSKRTLYVYYPSKEDLFVDVLRKLTIENPQTRALESMEGMSPENREELGRDLLEMAQKIVTTMMQPDYLALLRTTIADIHRFPQLAGLFRATVPERAMNSFAVFTGEAKRYPNFRLEMNAEAKDLILEDGIVRGVRYETPEGSCEARALLTVAADGRSSPFREQAGLKMVRTSPPIDVLWFRLSRQDGDPEDTFGYAGGGRFMVVVNRGEYWQIAYVIRKGDYQKVRDDGLEDFRVRNLPARIIAFGIWPEHVKRREPVARQEPVK